MNERYQNHESLEKKHRKNATILLKDMKLIVFYYFLFCCYSLSLSLSCFSRFSFFLKSEDLMKHILKENNTKSQP